MNGGLIGENTQYLQGNGDDNRNDTRKENILEMDIMVKPSIGIP